MPKFSLRHIFVAVVALAMGLSIARLAGGRWFDLPLAVLSFYYVLSLCRQAGATRSKFKGQAGLPREQRWGGRILVALLVGTAATLIVAWGGIVLLAARLMFIPSEVDPFPHSFFPLRPQDLVALAMLVAIGLGSWQCPPLRPPTARQRVVAVLAGGMALVLLLVYWVERILLWFLVYLAIQGVESAQSPKALPPDLDVNAVDRMQRFAAGGVIGLLFVIANVLLIAALAKWWPKPRVRSALFVLLVLGLGAQCASAGWIAGAGLWQLSPAMQEGIRFPPLELTVLAAAMASLAAGAFSWRLLAARTPVERAYQSAAPSTYLHEHWIGCLALGIVAVSHSIITVIGNVSESVSMGFRLDWQLLGYSLIYRPAEFIWLAAAIGGFALAWVQWRRRKRAAANELPCINPAQFTVLTVSMLIAVVASAPIVAALSFSYWFVDAELF